MRHLGRAVILALSALLAVACGGSPGNPHHEGGNAELRIGAIPDQDPQKLQRTYGVLSDWLSSKLGVKVEYVPVTDYTASVSAFVRGDLDLVFFGGLTAVQAMHQLPGAAPIVQRDIDAEFRSVFVANVGSNIKPVDGVAGLKTLAGHRYTFGSDTSTSGRLMPQFFLQEAGVGVGDFAGEPGFSGSHDATWKLVQEGTYEVGALNAAVWDDRLASGAIDRSKVREVFRTPSYHDYCWVARPDLDKRFGDGFTGKVTAALLAIDGSDEHEHEILQAFAAQKFIPTEAANYAQIEAVARDLGLLN
ncbi:putative selenate ABC transporter substrate-binding protein [Nocardia sp. NPDC046473]|uniref:putative selenate ABC transporter substrate-binding protein n=1 Tax=Nocardia sp. NPDC046473 TaxID=3155733 RepID=UPI0033EF7968